MLQRIRLLCCIVCCLVGCRTSSLYLTEAAKYKAQRQPGRAMATYDAYLDEHPNDRRVQQMRDDAARSWLRIQLTKAKQRKGSAQIGFLLALGQFAKQRKLHNFIANELSPLLDTTLTRQWPLPQHVTNTAQLDTRLARGAFVAQYLNKNARFYRKFQRFQKEAATYHRKQAQQKQHPASIYLHHQIARIYDGSTTPSHIKNRYHEKTRLNYLVEIRPNPRCRRFVEAFQARRRKVDVPLFPSKGRGRSVRVTLFPRCEQFRESLSRKINKRCTKMRVQSGSQTFCRRQFRQSSSMSFRYKRGSMTMIRHNRSWRVKTCNTYRWSKRIREIRRGALHTRWTKHSWIAGGPVLFQSPNHRMLYIAHIATHVTDKSWRGPCGRGSTRGSRKQVAKILGHGIWLELYNAKFAFERQLARDAYRRAQAHERNQDLDRAIGERVVAIRILQRVSSQDARWFQRQLQLSSQSLKEALLNAPRLLSLNDKFAYQLRVPKVDPALKRRVQEARYRSGNDGY